MNNTESFYYDILNINKRENKLDKIKEIVKNNKQEIKYTDGFCKVMTNNIGVDLKEANIAFKTIKTTDIFEGYEHHFIIAYYKKEEELEYILIDPTYKQFIKDKNQKLIAGFEEWPGVTLEKTKKGLNLSKNLLLNGYCIVNNEDILLYLKSFSRKEDNVVFNISDIIINNHKNLS